MQIENEQFQRTRTLIGDDSLKKLFNSRVIVFGIGGVGGYVVEALARAGIGEIDLVDNDTINLSNLNRQIVALYSTLNEFKVEVARARILDINPQVKVNAYKNFFSDENSSEFDFLKYDYIIDAIDSVKSKIELIKCAKNAGVSIISSMGTGNKMNPSMLEISDISKTSVCPLARVMRSELKKQGIKNLKVVYSKEEPIKTGLRTPSSNSFVPSSAGLLIASDVVRDLINY